MINELIKLATHLDRKGLHREANYIDAVIKKTARTLVDDITTSDQCPGEDPCPKAKRIGTLMSTPYAKPPNYKFTSSDGSYENFEGPKNLIGTDTTARGGGDYSNLKIIKYR